MHVGLYVYRRDTLLGLATLDADPLEQTEALEQLRALEHGIRIKVVETKSTNRSASTRRTTSNRCAGLLAARRKEP